MQTPLFFSTLVLYTILSIFKCDYIAQSTVQKCYQTTSDPSNCSEKLVIVLSLENGQIANTEQIQATLNSTTQNGVTRQLANNLIIEVTKSPVTALFPLKYVQDFNNQPTERVITTSLFSCKDGYYDSSPTCGFQHDSKGNKILDSQGFCCYCSLSDIIGMGNSLSRGKVCYALNLGTGSATASCLNFDSLWYSAYSIQQYQLYFEVVVNVYEVDSSNNKNLKWSLPLSTSNPTLSSSDKSVIANIVGTFTPTQPPADLSSFYLVKPSSPSTNPRVIAGTNAWMFIDKTMFTLDGTQCNKIGVSYTAFRGQPSGCSSPLGSCLLNQLENLYQNDLTLLAANKAPNYLLSSQGNFNQVLYQNQTTLQQVLSGSASTMITIEIDAAQIKFVTNLGAGKFVYAGINNFQSHSGNGLFVSQIQNQANFSAEFIIGFNCTSNVQAIQAAKLFLTANQIYNYNCSVYVIDDSAVNNNNCTTYLYDAIGDVLDSKNLLFNTTSITPTNNQGNNTDKGNQTQVYEDTKSCNDKCSSFWNFFCYLSAGCISAAFKSLGTLLGITGFIGLLIWLTKNGYLIPIVRAVCCCCCKSQQDKEKELEQKKKKDEKRKKEDFDKSQSDKSICSQSQSQSLSQSQSQSYATPTKTENKYARKKQISRKYSNNKRITENKNDESHLEDSLQINKCFVNIDKASFLFSAFKFKKSFSFIMIATENRLQFPKGSPVPDLVGMKSKANSEYIIQKLLNVIRHNASELITDSPLYLLVE